MITVTSPAFKEGETIPEKYTADGENISPPLEWTGIPVNTESIAVFVEDPDAPGGIFTHWVVFNLIPEVTGLPEGVPAQQSLEHGGKQTLNSFNKIGYGGPAPPPDDPPHRYFFRVYALDRVIDARPGLPPRDADKMMMDHIIAKGELMGKYGRG